MSKLPEIIGIKSEQEALLLIEKEKAAMEKENREIIRTTLLGIVILLIGSFALSSVIYLFSKSIFSCMPFGLIVGIIWMLWPDLFQRRHHFAKCEYSLPVQYYWLTNGKNVLKYKIYTHGFIHLVLEDVETHEVKHADLGDFQTVVKTDVQCVIADLDTGKIYIPYNE